MPLSGFDRDIQVKARHLSRNRFNAALVGWIGIVWWIPVWVLLPDHHDVMFFGFTSVLGAGLFTYGLWWAHLIGEDLRNMQVSQETFEMLAEVKVYGYSFYRWRSGSRRLDCRTAMAPWGPSQGDLAVIRFLPRSGVPVSVAPAAAQA